jgi:branched-chain amino acid transport system substrate-binding protein
MAAALAAALTVTASAQEPIKIGFVSTFSGPSGGLGQELLDGFKLGLKKLGNKLGGRPVELIQGDDQAKPDVGRQVADKMVERDRVHILTGVNFSNVMLALAKPALDAGVFVISVNAGPSQYAGLQCHPHYFSASFQNDTAPEAMGIYMQGKGIKRVYLMAPNYPPGRTSSRASSATSRARSSTRCIPPSASSTMPPRSPSCATRSRMPCSSSILAEWASISSSNMRRPD